jgi:hypothetical protein
LKEQQPGPIYRPLMAETYRAGDHVEYIAGPVFDLMIQTGDVGVVTKVESGWVHAEWPRSGEHSVPLRHVREAPGQSGMACRSPWNQRRYCTCLADG